MWASDPNSQDAVISIAGSSFIATPDYYWAPSSASSTRYVQQLWNQAYPGGPTLPALLPAFPYFDTDSNGSPVPSPAMAPMPSLTWNGQPLLLYGTNSAGSIVPATLPASLYANSALYSAVIANPLPGGAASAPVTVRIAAPTPQLTSLSPSTVMPGSAGFTLQVFGTSQIPTTKTGTANGFVANSVVNWTSGGSTQPLPTTYVSPTEVDAAVPASLLGTAAAISITVVNPDVELDGTVDSFTSNALPLAIGYPVPAITALSPSGAVPGDAWFSQTGTYPQYNLTITGSGFVSGCTVLWNGSPRQTQYVSPTTIQAGILPADVAQAGTNEVTVTNPGGQVSAQQSFVVTAQTPTVTLLAPNAAPQGSPDTTITIIGTNFYSGSTVQCGSTQLTPQYLGSTQLLATLPAALLTTPGPVTITVTNPNSGGSSSAVFTVGTGGIASVTLATSQCTGGASVTGTVTLSAAATSATKITLASNNTAITVPAFVTVASGARSATFKASTGTVTSQQTGAITATHGTDAASAQLTVLPVSLASVSVSPALIRGGTSGTGTVTLSTKAGIATTVTLTSSNPVASVPASVQVQAGSTSATFKITTTAVATPVTSAVTAAFGGSRVTAQLTVRPPGVATLTISPSSVTGGASATGTITLEAAAPAGGILVSLSSDTAAASVPTSVVIPQGAKTATFQVLTSAVTASTTVHITAGANGTSLPAVLTVTP
jgi:hypothetical protein